MTKQVRRSNPRMSKTKLTAIIVLSCVAIAGAFDALERFRISPSGVFKTRALGDPKARIHIVEHIDFECPECAKGAALIKEYVQRYPQFVYLEVKYFPNKPDSVESALYAECAAQQNKFWGFYDLLFERQWEWMNKKNAAEVFQKIAKGMEIDMVKLAGCVTGTPAQASIFADKTEGEIKHIARTPTYFINGKMFVGYRELKDRLEELKTTLIDDFR